MNEVAAILDENGLTTLDGVKDFLHRRPYSDVVSLAYGLEEAVRAGSRSLKPEGAEPALDEANFLASSSMRGHRSCSNWDCRGPRVESLSRYVALYCDKAIVPANFGARDVGKDERAQMFQRMGLLTSLSELLLLRPLIDEGLIVLVQEELHFCKKHWQEAVPEHAEIIKAAERLARKHSDEFEMTYAPKTVRGQLFPMLSIKGPADYIEHGMISTLLSEKPAWVADRNKSRSLRLTKQFVKKHKLILPLFMSIANDAFLQTYFGIAFNARYLTDSPGDAEFFRVLNADDELNRETATLCTHLTHTIPMLRDVPIEAVLKVRRNEPEAFQSYRSTLTSIVRDYVRKGKTVSGKDASDIYLDLLKPRLDALQLQARNLRRAQVKRSALKVAASSALVGMGIYSGLLPAHLVDLVKTIGGFSVAKDLAETMAAIERNPTEVRNHNLYFLLRLKQDSAQ